MKLLHTFMERELVDQYVGYKPAWEESAKNSPRPRLWLLPSPHNTMYDFTADGHLFIYLFRSSTAFLFKGKKMIRKFDIYIDRINGIYRKKAKKTFDAQKQLDPKRATKICQMFSSCFVDKDEPYFYLQIKDVNELITLYKFDLSRRLVKIIKDIKAFIRVKRNGLFYDLTGGEVNPVILKIKEKK